MDNIKDFSSGPVLDFKGASWKYFLQYDIFLCLQILNEEITPTLKKLKEERSTYLEFQKIQRELEPLPKLWIAYTFISAEKASEKMDEETKQVEETLDTKGNEIEAGKTEITNINQNVEELQR